MAKNEDGEFELILGNRQLLSVFFIVVILLGVFFTMGYIVGHNSGPTPATDVAVAKPESKPMVVNSPARESLPPPAETPKAEPEKTITDIVQPEKTPEPKKPEPRKSEPVKQVKAEKPKSVEPSKPAPAASGDLPAVGQTYLQLAATGEHEAKLEVDVLRKKGFKAVAAEIPEKRGTFRVLVGPIGEGAANKTKSDLSAAGFPGDRAIRRTF